MLAGQGRLCLRQLVLSECKLSPARPDPLLLFEQVHQMSHSYCVCLIFARVRFSTDALLLMPLRPAFVLADACCCAAEPHQ